MRTDYFDHLFEDQPVAPLFTCNEIKPAAQSQTIKVVSSKPSPPTLKRTTQVYRVVVDTDGTPKGMTVIDPSGDDLEAFTKSVHRRFGKDRVISIEQRKRE